MSSSEQVRTAWNTAILQHATVQGYTTRTFTYKPPENNADQIAALMFGADAKYVNYLYLVATRRETETGASNGVHEYIHRVTLVLTMEDIPSGANRTAIVDRINAIHELVYTELGLKWNGVLNGFYNHIEISNVPEEVEVNGRPCLRMTSVYEGNDRVTIN